MDSRHIAAIDTERARQVKLGYDQAHDDAQSSAQWVDDIKQYAEKIRERDGAGDLNGAKQAFIQVAALAVAGMEAIDRLGAADEIQVMLLGLRRSYEQLAQNPYRTDADDAIMEQYQRMLLALPSEPVPMTPVVRVPNPSE